MKSNNFLLKTALFMGISAFSIGVANADITTGLVADFPFSGHADDVSPNGYSSTVFDAELTEDRFNTPNNAYKFVSGQYIHTDVDGSKITNSMSISFWMKTDLACHKAVTGWCDWDKAPYLYSTKNGEDKGHHYHYVGDSNRSDTSSFKQNLYNNKWNHIVINYSENSTNIFVNKAKLATQSHGGFVFKGDTFLFGKEKTSKGAYYNGAIDDIKIYNRVLTKEDIKELFNSPKTSEPPKILDIDDNGSVEAYTDHILLLRHNLGFMGDDLIYNATASDCKRCSADEIKKYLDKVANHSALTIK